MKKNLWGLLIAHQCNEPHQWNDSEKNLLIAIAEQLAIAIHQTELMQTLTQEKQTLEQLTNAIKFTPESGSVTLRLWVEDDTAIFQVEDTGIDIPEEQLPLLFEKFQQLDTPYRRRYEGTGLGLALTKQLVELHRGRIEVESTVSIGSIFTVWIPTQTMRVVS